MAFSTYILNYATESYAKTYELIKKKLNNFCMYSAHNYKLIWNSKHNPTFDSDSYKNHDHRNNSYQSYRWLQLKQPTNQPKKNYFQNDFSVLCKII